MAEFGFMRRRPLLVAAAALGAMFAAWQAAPAVASQPVARAFEGSGYGFNDPCAIARNGMNLWVTSCLGNSATEFKQATGGLVRVIRAPSFHFVSPDAILDGGGSRLWIADGGNCTAYGLGHCIDNAVTEISGSNGSLIRVLDSASYKFDAILGLASDGTHLWVASGGGILGASNLQPCITEVDESSGNLVRVLRGSSEGLNWPLALASDGTHLWIANSLGNSVTEIDEATGSLVQVLRGGAYRFANPDALATVGTHLWVANNRSLTEVDESNGKFVRLLSSSAFRFSDPAAFAAEGHDLWIANETGDSVTEISDASGALVRVLRVHGYRFSGPTALASAGGDLWIVNGNGNSVTEVSEATGRLIRLLSN